MPASRPEPLRRLDGVDVVVELGRERVHRRLRLLAGVRVRLAEVLGRGDEGIRRRLRLVDGVLQARLREIPRQRLRGGGQRGLVGRDSAAQAVRPVDGARGGRRVGALVRAAAGGEDRQCHDERRAEKANAAFRRHGAATSTGGGGGAGCAARPPRAGTRRASGGGARRRRARAGRRATRIPSGVRSACVPPQRTSSRYANPTAAQAIPWLLVERRREVSAGPGRDLRRACEHGAEDAEEAVEDRRPAEVAGAPCVSISHTWCAGWRYCVVTSELTA